MKRRLAAILTADVAGYTRLMGRDEEATLARLKLARQEVIDPAIAKHDGRVVKLMGDGVLAEFASLVAAVQCAVHIQEAMTARDTDLPEERRMLFRIGVNVGDVIVDDNDIYGDGVNIAARLQELALPGGICVTGDVYHHIERKLKLVVEDIGEVSLKNVGRPVRIYRVLVPGSSAAEVFAPGRPLPVPDKPSIAVLPFANMSGDPAQDYFSDGIAEDIITILSRYRWFFVIARGSSFAYSTRGIDVRQVGRELGVRYVLEGSVRKAGNSVRITARLVDATTGKEMWAERYDRELADMFAVQDEITETIVAAVEPELATLERERALRKPPESLDAWDSYQRGLWHFYGDWTRNGVAEAKRLLEGACALDPGFGSAYAELAFAHIADIVRDFSEDPRASLDAAAAAAAEAVALDGRDPAAHSALGRVLIYRHSFERAIEECETALTLSPSSDRAHYCLGLSLLYGGKPEEAIPQFERALRLNPCSPMLWAYCNNLGRCHFRLQRYREALVLFIRATQQANVPYLPFVHLAATLGHLGRTDEAESALAEVRRRKDDFSFDTIHRTIGVYGPHAGPKQIIEGLEKAGLPA